eukprot:10531961-Prorocentrum_lima.AAC.1
MPRLSMTTPRLPIRWSMVLLVLPMLSVRYLKLNQTSNTPQQKYRKGPQQHQEKHASSAAAVADATAS